MKNTVFTVIAVLLLLATAQFAVGFPVEWQGGVPTDITIYNDGDTWLYISLARHTGDINDTMYWETYGWWGIWPGESREFTNHNQAPVYVRMITAKLDDEGQEFREVIPAIGRAFYARDSQETGFRNAYKDSASFFTAMSRETAHDGYRQDWVCSHKILQTSPRANAHFSNPAEPLEWLESNTYIQTQSGDVSGTWFDPNGLTVRGGYVKRIRLREAPDNVRDRVRIERATYHRYPYKSIVRVGGHSMETIDGLELRASAGGIPRPASGGNKFIILQQYGNTCGPTSLEMVLHYYGKEETMEDIWRAGDIDTVKYGTWPGEMRQALNELGVPAHLYDEDTDGYRNDPFERLRRYVDGNRPPCILIRYLDKPEGGTTEAAYHWVVVVGYLYDKKNGAEEYLLADPHGRFRWETRSRLDTVWGFKTYGGDYAEHTNYWDGGFHAAHFWRDAAIDLAADPYTAIVPRSAPTKHPKNYWTEYGDNGETDEERFGPKGYYKVKGKAKVAAGVINFLTFGLVGEKATRSWSETIEFDHKFDRYTVSAIKLFSWGGTATLSGHEKDGDRGVKIWGKVEDGAVVRGELDVMVRTYRSERSPAAPSKVTLTRLPEPAAATALLPNYPNPFNPETWIPYQLSKPADVAVSIYAIDGRLVRRLDLGQMPSGVYRSRARAAYWDGRNATGEPVASGIYFYTLQAGDFISTRKMVIRK